MTPLEYLAELQDNAPHGFNADISAWVDENSGVARALRDLETRDGEIITSAIFGESWLVLIEYNTDFDGRPIDPGKEECPVTYHGTFDSPEEAEAWVDAYPDGDTDINDMRVININQVRPKEES